MEDQKAQLKKANEDYTNCISKDFLTQFLQGK